MEPSPVITGETPRDSILARAAELQAQTMSADAPAVERACFMMNLYNLLAYKGVLAALDADGGWECTKSLWARYKFFRRRKFEFEAAPEMRAGGGNGCEGTLVKTVALHELEHKIKRVMLEEMKDPRFHFLINCASLSCPALPRRRLQAATYEDVATATTRAFVNDDHGCQYDEATNTVRLSMIFKWYRNDFERVGGGVLPFVRQYWAGAPLGDGARVEFMPWDWGLCRQF